MAEVTFRVSEIHCEGCASRIETGLERMAGYAEFRLTSRATK